MVDWFKESHKRSKYRPKDALFFCDFVSVQFNVPVQIAVRQRIRLHGKDKFDVTVDGKKVRAKSRPS